jgi:hypothetical protein
MQASVGRTTSNKLLIWYYVTCQPKAVTNNYEGEKIGPANLKVSDGHYLRWEEIVGN